MKKRAFCDTTMAFDTQIICPIKRVSRRDPNHIRSVGAVTAIFKMADMDIQCPISRRII